MYSNIERNLKTFKISSKTQVCNRISVKIEQKYDLLKGIFNIEIEF